jgi:hypothetical protein
VGEPIVLHVRTFSGPMAERDPMPQ